MDEFGRTRLFLALWPPEPVVRELVALQSAWTWPPPARVVAASQLHLTLHFLGPVASAEVPALHRALAQVRFEPLDLASAGDGARVWPGGTAVLEWPAAPALSRLHAALGDALAKAGRAVEARPYRPHVTLARKAQHARPPAACAPLHWRADHGYVLARSEPGRGSTVLHAFC